MTEQVDTEIGRIESVLRERGLYENTLLIFTSDHGKGMAQHRWVVKLMLYGSTCAVPLIMRFPGRISRGVLDSTHLVSLTDILPTMCDYGGIEIPEGLDGESLRPIVEDQSLPGRDSLIAELDPDPKHPEMKGRMLRTRRYKSLVFTHGRNPEALFDMENDPGETVNIATDPSAQNILREHQSLLEKILVQTDNSFVSCPVNPRSSTGS